MSTAPPDQRGRCNAPWNLIHRRRPRLSLSLSLSLCLSLSVSLSLSLSLSLSFSLSLSLSLSLWTRRVHSAAALRSRSKTSFSSFASSAKVRSGSRGASTSQACARAQASRVLGRYTRTWLHAERADSANSGGAAAALGCADGREIDMRFDRRYGCSTDRTGWPPTVKACRNGMLPGSIMPPSPIFAPKLRLRSPAVNAVV